MILFKRRNTYPDKSAHIPFFTRNSVISSVLKDPVLKKAKKAGALEVIGIWKEHADKNVNGQYLPFTSGHRNCPAVRVDETTGNKLFQLAGKDSSIRFVIDVQHIENATSRTIYAMLPGANTSEAVIISTYIDGPNACEENGPVALLALAYYFSGIPVKQRSRTIIILFVTRHFQLPQFTLHGQASTRWLHRSSQIMGCV